MAARTRNQSNIKHGTIELVLLLLLQGGKKYGYQLSQELADYSDGDYELKEPTMYPTLYRLEQNGFLKSEQVLVGVRRTRVYYTITETGQQYLSAVRQEYDKITGAIKKIIDHTEAATTEDDSFYKEVSS